jgi:O-antigen/teichoic acid export membrane protein
MSRTEKFIKNTIATAILQIITMLAGFIIPKVMLSVYGSEINGLVSSITELISYLTLVEAGLSGATVYSLYKPLSENNTYSINRILSAAKKFYYRTGFLFLGVLFACAFVYPLFINTDLLGYTEILLLVIVLGVNGILEFFTLAKYRSLLIADQKTYIISFASIIQVVLNVTIIVALSLNSFSIVITRLVAVFAILIRTVILWIYCREKYGYLDFSVEPDNASMSKRWDALYLQIIGVIHSGAPIMIATFMLSLKEVSVYSIYYLIVNGINAILSIFTNGVSAGFGDLIIRDEKKNFKRVFQQFEYMYYAIITIVYSIMMMTYIPFIKVYTVGADLNYNYPVLGVLMTINGFLYNLKTPYGMLTIAAGKYKESRVQITIQGALEILAGVILAKYIGLYGIVLGSILSNIYRDIDFIFFAPKYLTQYSFGSSLKIWIRSILLVLFIIVITSFIPTFYVSGYLTWILYACIISIIAVIITFIANFIIDPATLVQNYKQVKNIISRK